jgi:hypothetical protein
MTIWYTVCSFGTFIHVLVSCTKENLATLVHSGFNVLRGSAKGNFYLSKVVYYKKLYVVLRECIFPVLVGVRDILIL